MLVKTLLSCFSFRILECAEKKEVNVIKNENENENQEEEVIKFLESDIYINGLIRPLYFSTGENQEEEEVIKFVENDILDIKSLIRPLHFSTGENQEEEEVIKFVENDILDIKSLIKPLYFSTGENQEEEEVIKFVENDILDIKSLIKPLYFSTILESYKKEILECYKIGILNEKIIREYIIKTNQLLSVIPIDDYIFCKEYRQEIEMNIEKITSLMLAFPFTNDEIFNDLIYYVNNEISIRTILSLLSSFSLIKKVVDLKSITAICEQICKLAIESKRIMQKEGENLEQIELWKRILLSPMMTILRNKDIHQLFLKRDNIIEKIFCICQSKNLEIKQRTEVEELYLSIVDSSFHKNLTEKTKILNDKIAKLHYEIVDHHYSKSQKKLPFIITEKTSNSPELLSIKKEICRKSNSLSEESQQMKDICKKIGVYKNENFSPAEVVIDLSIQRAITEHLTVIKVLILMNEFSRHFEDMISQSRENISSLNFIELLKRPELNQLDGVASMLCIAKIVNGLLDEMIKDKKESKKMYIMSRFFQALEENSSNSFVKKMLIRMEEIRLACNESVNLLNKKEEEFEKMFVPSESEIERNTTKNLEEVNSSNALEKIFNSSE